MTFLDAVGYETVHLALAAEIININGITTANQLKSRGFSCSRVGTESARPDKFLVTGSGSDTVKNSPGTFRRLIITDTGVGGATITFFDATSPGTNEIISVDLTETLIVLEMGFDFNFGLSFTATGASFELLVVFD